MTNNTSNVDDANHYLVAIGFIHVSNKCFHEFLLSSKHFFGIFVSTQGSILFYHM